MAVARGTGVVRAASRCAGTITAGAVRRGGGFAPDETIDGPATAAVLVARTATTPALAANALAPVPAISSAIRSALGGPAPEAPAAAAHCASGSGTTAVAAARSVNRARCTSWRTAPSVTPSSRATSCCERPSTVICSSASRWRSRNAARPVSVWRTTARRSISSCGASDSRSASLSSA